jgi:hypothetical protein
MLGCTAVAAGASIVPAASLELRALRLYCGERNGE